ncbi:MAG: PAS domain-containing protein [Rhizobiales bacterium]|nr:PAS domain-containing protein [Hyphomicrobiales bacterium]
MKHPASREFFAYWDEKRGLNPAPDRSELEPGPVRELLGDIFVLSCDPAAGYPFRVAGTRVCALLGQDLKGAAFAALFQSASRIEIEDILDAVNADKLAAVVGITARTSEGRPIPLELLLLPFHTRAHMPISMTGLMVPFVDSCQAVTDLALTSWRYMGHPPQRFAPRILRKLTVARGLMVYEGLV